MVKTQYSHVFHGLTMNNSCLLIFRFDDDVDVDDDEEEEHEEEEEEVRQKRYITH